MEAGWRRTRWWSGEAFVALWKKERGVEFGSPPTQKRQSLRNHAMVSFRVDSVLKD